MKENKTTQLYIDDHIVMLTAYPAPEVHEHLAAHLLIATDAVLSCRIDGEEVSGRAILIASNVAHTASVTSGRMYMFMFDETSADTESLKRNFLRDSKYCIIDESVYRQMHHYMNEDLPTFDNEVRKILELSVSTTRSMDERIANAIAYLRKKQPLEENIIDILSKEAFLSKSRFSHLFKKEIGVALNSYLVMVKIRKTYEFFLSGISLTDACLQAGFNSSSHFSATCKKTFGLSFTTFSKTV